MKNKLVLLFTVLLSTAPLAVFAQSLDVRGTCTVEITGTHNITIQGNAPAVNGGPESKAANILWSREYYAALSKKSPQAASMYEHMLEASEANGGLFGLMCSGKDGYLTISSMGFEMDNEAFAGKTGNYPLIGGNAASDLPPGMMTGIIVNKDGAMLVLSPDKQAGQLSITKFTNKDIAGTYTFSDKGSKVNGKFEFTRVDNGG